MFLWAASLVVAGLLAAADHNHTDANCTACDGNRTITVRDTNSTRRVGDEALLKDLEFLMMLEVLKDYEVFSD